MGVPIQQHQGLLKVSSQTRMNQTELAQTFAALGDPLRVTLISRLQQEGTLSLSELCTDVVITRQAVSKHLRTLTEARLISFEKTGRETHFRLEIERLEIANQFLNDVAMKWDSTLARLKENLEAK